MSRFDRYYRRSILSKVFTKGWGNPDVLLRIIENHKYVSKRETCKNLIAPYNIITHKKNESNNAIIVEGSFLSPFHSLMPTVMTENNQIARFQLLIPKVWDTRHKPLVIHFPGTGDHHYSRRKTFLAYRLLKFGIASLLHINPFYGNRKPKDQKGSSLNYLSDLFVMGGAIILETQVLLQWAKKEGFGPLVVHGISMGGHMACLATCPYPEPVCLVPCLSWTTASHVFTQGAMSSSVSWDILSDQYNNDEIFSKKIRAAIDPPIPLHLRNLMKPIITNGKGNSINREENKLKTPFDKIERKFHLLVPNKDYGESNRWYTTDKAVNEEKVSKFKSFRNAFSWNRPLELISFMRTVTESDKITNEDLNDINEHETEMKAKQTFEKFFSRTIPVDHATVQFMRDILDFFTHLGNYSVPIDTRLVTMVVAGNDAYIPIEGVSHLNDIWGDQCDIRICEGIGHVEAYLRSSVWTEDRFREAIVDTLNRYLELYYNEKGMFGQKKS